MISELSILIPAYNRDCVKLVRSLCSQANREEGFRYEIIVADDASSDGDIKARNRQLADDEHCHVEELDNNLGRARIRNFLANEAHYQWLLFLDSDVQLAGDDFIKKYRIPAAGAPIIYGGVCLPPQNYELSGNLRYKYEAACLSKFGVEKRKQAPYHGFRSTNFLIRRDVMRSYPFDPHIVNYGYEDVLFGKTLRTEHIPIDHIDNPVAIDDFETNSEFLKKTEEGLHTLYDIRVKMEGYCHILTVTERFRKLCMLPLIRWAFRHTQQGMRKNMLGVSPNVTLYNLFRLGYFATLYEKE